MLVFVLGYVHMYVKICVRWDVQVLVWVVVVVRADI